MFNLWLMRLSHIVAVLVFIAGSRNGGAQNLNLPPRPAHAPSGTEFVEMINAMDFVSREREIFSQITMGNVPDFLRKLQPVAATNVFDGKTNTGMFYVTPDYLCVGSDDDYFLSPMTPSTAQRIADRLDCSLPTRRMVDVIYEAAAVKLMPVPIAPGAAMITVPVFSNHNAIVRTQRIDQLKDHPLGALVAGHQKDVVIAAGLASAPGNVAIYGWHKTNGAPIQPLYLKHVAAWVDYSQCVRLVQNRLTVNGQSNSLAAVLADPELSGLFSDEGTLADPRYPTNEVAPLGTRTTPLPQAKEVTGFQGFETSTNFNERIGSFRLEPEVRVLINAPPLAESQTKRLLLIFYALPNGSTIEQTMGRSPSPGNDWRFDIQHIAAQTRFLRQTLTNRSVVVAYLENDLRSWPGWRRKYGDGHIPEVMDAIRKVFVTNEMDVVLTGHSGGGSFTFGYLNRIERIPDEIARIAFLDSNYAYDPALEHGTKLTAWLKSSTNHVLCVLAYNDAIARLDGKPFVSAAGGTWGRSATMLSDLKQHFQFTSRTNGDLERFTALDGRIEFVLHGNSEKKILHTVQVERNGFIHAMLVGTRSEDAGYEYFGERAYSKWVTRD
jgi:hypothetical protein